MASFDIWGCVDWGGGGIINFNSILTGPVVHAYSPYHTGCIDWSGGANHGKVKVVGCDENDYYGCVSWGVNPGKFKITMPDTALYWGYGKYVNVTFSGLTDCEVCIPYGLNSYKFYAAAGLNGNTFTLGPYTASGGAGYWQKYTLLTSPAYRETYTGTSCSGTPTTADFYVTIKLWTKETGPELYVLVFSPPGGDSHFAYWNDSITNYCPNTWDNEITACDWGGVDQICYGGTASIIAHSLY